MTGALPYQRVGIQSGPWAEVIVTDPTVGEVRVTVRAEYLGTTTADEIIRKAIERQRERLDQVRGERS